MEITEGQTADIIIREGDDPTSLANEFARQYGISSALRDLLADQVQEKLETFLYEEQVYKPLDPPQQLYSQKQTASNSQLLPEPLPANNTGRTNNSS